MPFYEQSLPCTAVANVDMVYQITASDCSIFCDASENGPFDVYLPQASITRDHPFLIKKMDDSANAITILPHGTDKIEDGDSYVLDTPGQKVVLVYRGGYADILPPTPNWEIIEQAVEYEAVSF